MFCIYSCGILRLFPSVNEYDKRIRSKALPANVRVGTSFFRKRLQLHSEKPLTSFLRNGCCEIPPDDYGNHSVAGKLY